MPISQIHWLTLALAGTQVPGLGNWEITHFSTEATMFDLTLCLAIYLAIDLILLCLGFVQMLRQESQVAQVLAITLLWPWVVFQAALSIGLKIIRQLRVIVGKTLYEMRLILGV
jgi:hypothetical protein